MAKARLGAKVPKGALLVGRPRECTIAFVEQDRSAFIATWLCAV